MMEWASWLKMLGEGSTPTHPDLGCEWIELPPDYVLERASLSESSGVGALISHVWQTSFDYYATPGAIESLQAGSQPAEDIVARAILTPRNNDVDFINEVCVRQFLPNH
jgi:hypothetical protein